MFDVDIIYYNDYWVVLGCFVVGFEKVNPFRDMPGGYHLAHGPGPNIDLGRVVVYHLPTQLIEAIDLSMRLQ